MVGSAVVDSAMAKILAYEISRLYGYLPVPWRGQTNEPAYVRQVAEFVAQLRGVSLETLAQQTAANARDLFGLASVGDGGTGRLGRLGRLGIWGFGDLGIWGTYQVN